MDSILAAPGSAGLEKIATPRPAPTSDPDRAVKAAEEFEAFFLSQMLGHMFSGVETDKVFGGGHSEDIYRSLMVDEYGKIIARSGGIGIASTVKAEILRMQEQGK